MQQAILKFGLMFSVREKPKNKRSRSADEDPNQPERPGDSHPLQSFYRRSLDPKYLADQLWIDPQDEAPDSHPQKAKTEFLQSRDHAIILAGTSPAMSLTGLDYKPVPRLRSHARFLLQPLRIEVCGERIDEGL
jgi:hypothetical protein